MTRIERIRNMTVKEIAKVIIDNNITDEFCRSQCKNDEECLHDLECCIKWLEEESEVEQDEANNQNPAVKSCVTCRHKDIKSTFDEVGNCIDVISWCFAMERAIFCKGYPIKHCTGWQGEESEVEHDG